ncbi:hypothetical protein GCM10020001_079970 [Nonomuraea salmonea]
MLPFLKKLLQPHPVFVGKWRRVLLTTSIGQMTAAACFAAVADELVADELAADELAAAKEVAGVMRVRVAAAVTAVTVVTVVTVVAVADLVNAMRFPFLPVRTFHRTGEGTACFRGVSATREKARHREAMPGRSEKPRVYTS